MAEEKLKYRVELDPRQIEGQLANIRSAVGGALSNTFGGASSFTVGSLRDTEFSDSQQTAIAPSSPIPANIATPLPQQFTASHSSLGLGALTNRAISMAQYGATLARGAASSITRDIHTARQRIRSIPSIHDFTRAGVGGGLEAASAFASTAIPLTIASAGIFGVANTASGLFGAASAVGGGIGLLAKAAPTVAALAGEGIVGAGSMALSAATSPVALSLGAAYAAGKAVTRFGDNIIEDYQANSKITDIISSRGLSPSISSHMARGAISSGRSMGIGGAAMSGIFEAGLNSGLLGQMGSDPKELGKNLVDLAKQASTMSKILKSSLNEAITHMSELKKTGILQSDMAGITLSAQTMGNTTFMGTNAMLASASMGAKMATQYSVSSEMGAQVGIGSIGLAQSGMYGLSSAQLATSGGVGGLGQTIANARIGFMSSDAAKLIAASGKMSGFRSGQYSLSNIIQEVAKGLAASGSGGGAKYLLDADKKQSNLTSGNQRDIEFGMIKQISGMMGLDVSDQNDRATLALTYGKMLGLNTNTSEGRAQSMAMMNGMLDPSISAMNQINISNRIQDVRSEEYGFMNNIYKHLVRPVIGAIDKVSNPTSGVIQNLYSSTLKTTGNLSTGAGRFVRRQLRNVENFFGVDFDVRSAEEEAYTVQVPMAVGGMHGTVQLATQALASKHGMTVEEYRKTTKSTELPDMLTDKDTKGLRYTSGLFSKDIVLSEQTKQFQSDVSRTIGVINKMDAKKLATMSQTAALASVHIKMGEDAPTNEVITQALKMRFGRLQIDKTLDLNKQKLGKLYEEKLSELTKTLGRQGTSKTFSGYLTSLMSSSAAATAKGAGGTFSDMFHMYAVGSQILHGHLPGWNALLSPEYTDAGKQVIDFDMERKTLSSLVYSAKRSSSNIQKGVSLSVSLLSDDSSIFTKAAEAAKKELGNEDDYAKLMGIVTDIRSNKPLRGAIQSRLESLQTKVLDLDDIRSKLSGYNKMSDKEIDLFEKSAAGKRIITTGLGSSDTSNIESSARIKVLEGLVRRLDEQSSTNKTIMELLRSGKRNSDPSNINHSQTSWHGGD